MEAPASATNGNSGDNTLAVSIVTYYPDLVRLRATADALSRSVAWAQRAGMLTTVHLWLIDNTPDSGAIESIREIARSALEVTGVQLIIRNGHGNIGYGRAHNLALLAETCDYHLVLNPDAELAETALNEAIGFMQAHPEVGLLAPCVLDGRGDTQYLCKRFPAVLDLALRGFAPDFVKRMFAKRLAYYEMRDVIDAQKTLAEGIPIVSGAFMLVRRAVIHKTRGFDPQFFLYFEDFDWSLRLGKIAANAWVPSVRMVHHGGGAAKKGLRHIWMFVTGGWRFYRKHGWKFF